MVIKSLNLDDTTVRFLIIFLFYAYIAEFYINKKRQKYMSMPIKQTIGKKIGKIIDVSVNDTSLRTAYYSVKYAFEINGKKYKKYIHFASTDYDLISEKVVLYYRIGKKDITSKENPNQMYIEFNVFNYLFIFFMTAITYFLLF